MAKTSEVIGAKAGMTHVTVSHWRQRFIKKRLTGLADALGRGCKRHQAAPDPNLQAVERCSSFVVMV